MSEHKEQGLIDELTDAELNNLVFKIIEGSTEREISASSIADEALGELARDRFVRGSDYVAAHARLCILADAIFTEIYEPQPEEER
jgi:hypothetical protein